MKKILSILVAVFFLSAANANATTSCSPEFLDSLVGTWQGSSGIKNMTVERIQQDGKPALAISEPGGERSIYLIDEMSGTDLTKGRWEAYTSCKAYEANNIPYVLFPV